jgi:hypothetical protein
VVLLGVVALVVLAVGGVFAMRTMQSDEPVPTKPTSFAGGWDGSKPFTCGGDTEVIFGRIVAHLPGMTAITAGGNCHVRLDEVTITAGTALEASGRAVIEVSGGRMEGSTLTAHAAGNAEIHFKKTSIGGETMKEGNGFITGL